MNRERSAQSCAEVVNRLPDSVRSRMGNSDSGGEPRSTGHSLKKITSFLVSCSVWLAEWVFWTLGGRSSHLQPTLNPLLGMLESGTESQQQESDAEQQAFEAPAPKASPAEASPAEASPEQQLSPDAVSGFETGWHPQADPQTGAWGQASVSESAHAIRYRFVLEIRFFILPGKQTFSE